MNQRGVNPGHLSWKTIEVQGRRARYGEAGDGTPFVFLHGWGLSERTYKRALKRLVQMGLRVIAPSLPGFGGTAELPSEDFSLVGYAVWVSDFLDELGIDEPFYLCGHSFGGGVSIQTAYEYGDRVRLLVLLNSIGGAVWKDETKQLADRPLWDWGLHFPVDFASSRLMHMYKMAPVILNDVIRNLLNNPVAFYRVAHLIRTADLRAELEELKSRELPVVVLWGSADTILPLASQESLAEALGEQPEVVDGHHGWMIADPDAFGEIMTNVVAFAEYARIQEEREHKPVKPDLESLLEE